MLTAIELQHYKLYSHRLLLTMYIKQDEYAVRGVAVKQCRSEQRFELSPRVGSAVNKSHRLTHITVGYCTCTLLSYMHPSIHLQLHAAMVVLPHMQLHK